ncbi:type IV secretion system protein [Campylobacter sp. MIT 12-8780]|uniref:type IV secretion system protein n=1 Tax=unclassified Campylobacter TaxID=2593542 RepID=UPI00115F07CF|nr:MULTISPECIES: type IV secretion system protein [unclassified Campylobacter]NDJ28073.1 type IV secretion system protein [Campylobacter sp. MIT 19-121]TQR39962.1 type IV secretion system protein [Campylobacter sp. MIT 12-8780]
MKTNSFYSHDKAPSCQRTKKPISLYTKKIVILISFFLVSNQALAAGIPVIDAAANTQMQVQNAKQIAEWVKEATRWADTITHYKKQLQAYSDELNSLTGVKSSISSLRDLKQIYSDFGRAYTNIQDFNNKVLSDPMSFIKGELKDAYKKYTLFDRCENISNQEQKSLCMVDMLTYVAQEQNLDQSQKQLNTINQNLADLDQKLRKTQDIKEAQDIANAIASEGLKIQMIQSNINLQNAQYEKQRAIREEQAQQLFSKRASNTSYDTIQALGLD